MYPKGILVDDEHDLNIDWNARPEDEIQWVTTILSRIMIPQATPTLFWPCVPTWIKDGSAYGICIEPWKPEVAWIIDFCGQWSA